MWDERKGLYFDYNFEQQRRLRYCLLHDNLLSSVGRVRVAANSAARVAANLPMFERPGGLQTSTQRHRRSMGCSLRLGAIGDG